MEPDIDLRELLDQWPYDPDDHIRIVRGADGREILQVRLPVGIEQYEMTGRPDGQRPYGMESAFEYHRQRQAAAQAGDEERSYRLTPDDCAELFTEGVLYYYRYLHLFQLEDWPRTVRDTERNLLLFDFVHRYARRQEDRQHLEQWRPYILRMHAIARAMIEVERQKHENALAILVNTRRQIEELSELDNPTFTFERQRSLEALDQVRDQVARNRPVSELELLERALQRAIQSEDFERAAELRDRIRNLRSRGITA